MVAHWLVAMVLFTLVGVSLGLLGGGGSILAVPLLVYVARLDVHVAIGTSLAIVGATSLGGALVHARAGRVDFRAALVFGVAGMIAAPLGAGASHAVAHRVLLLLFAALMIVVGGPDAPRAAAGRLAACPSLPPRRLAILGAGFGVGALTGFLGVGGGFLIVPALTLLAGLPIHTAVGTSLLVIALERGRGPRRTPPPGRDPAGAHRGPHRHVPSSGRSWAGASSGRFEPARLRRAFAVFVILIGLALLAVNVAAGLRGVTATARRASRIAERTLSWSAGGTSGEGTERHCLSMSRRASQDARHRGQPARCSSIRAQVRGEMSPSR